MFRPRRKRVRGLTFVPSVGHYRDSLLSASSSRRSLTESEVETDDNLLDATGRRQPPNQYDIIAKLWMEQVDAKAVKKSSTMFLSVLPPGEACSRRRPDLKKCRCHISLWKIWKTRCVAGIKFVREKFGEKAKCVIWSLFVDSINKELANICLQPVFMIVNVSVHYLVKLS